MSSYLDVLTAFFGRNEA